MCIHVLKITLQYLLIAEIIEMAQPAGMPLWSTCPDLPYGFSSTYN